MTAGVLLCSCGAPSKHLQTLGILRPFYKLIKYISYNETIRTAFLFVLKSAFITKLVVIIVVMFLSARTATDLLPSVVSRDLCNISSALVVSMCVLMHVHKIRDTNKKTHQNVSLQYH